MDIVVKQLSEEIKIADLKPGDLFVKGNIGLEKIYMKTNKKRKDELIKVLNDMDRYIITCISMETGLEVNYEEETIVKKVQKITLEI